LATRDPLCAGILCHMIDVS